MKQLNIETTYDGIEVRADIECGINVLIGDSANGKSLLMKAVNAYCFEHNIACVLFDSKDVIKECSCGDEREQVAEKIRNDILNMAGKVEVLLLDNADLYLDNGTEEIREHFDLDNTIVLMCIHRHYKLGMIKRLVPRFDGMNLEV